MARWLFKTEPTDYSFERMLADKKTKWTGVKNALALQHLRKVKKGDEIAVYHTGSEKSVVGIARATAEAIAALRDEGGATDALGTAERGLSAAAHHDDRLAE